jgi:hypothetical protein
MVKQLRGSLRVSTEPGRGARFQMHLPLTVSVVRALVAEIGGEPYAFPLAFIVNTTSLARDASRCSKGRQHFDSNGRQVGLVSAVQVLGGHEPPGAQRTAGGGAGRPQQPLRPGGRPLPRACASWWCSRSIRAWARSRTSAPARCSTTARRC